MLSTRTRSRAYLAVSGAAQGFVLLAVLLGSSAAPAEEKKIPPAASLEVDFDKHIEPILKKACLRCHGPAKQKSNFRLDSREAALKGGDMGVAIVVGKSAESALVKLVSGLDEETQMPPSGDPLTPEEIGILRAWIDQGLKWGQTRAAEAEVVKLEKATFKGKSERVTAVALNRASGLLASAGGQSLPFRPGAISIWDIAAGKEVSQLEGHESLVWSVAFSPDGSKLATGAYNRQAKIWDAGSGKELANLEGHKNWVTAVAFSPDGATLATGSEDATIKLWDVATGKEKATLGGHGATVRAVLFADNGAALISASQDKTIKLWDLAAGKEKATLNGHEDGVFALALSADGKTLASGSADRTVRLWDLAEQKETRKLEGHKNWVVSLALSPNGWLASGSYDKTIKVWSLANGAELQSLPGHESAVWSLVFLPDGKTVASGSQDGTVKLWEVTPKPRVMTF
jgi:WD40 repeat protein